ncbi:hypothetical protein HFO82_33230 [Rhizobium leguminosarum]|uniref:hypothetical protein n=1 Tax=Rhizobium leguminosarum TaxID=384 RepID=UPI00103B01BA|nr:hypothetical protein [Rhizobium leguminosarum]MBY5503431.1 hypothetical protein [Rhizobium leguminosarum]TBZ68812.1 hypothetical protein E0H43_23435 [Rhizobium leguminosarum bv. viciae]
MNMVTSQRLVVDLKKAIARIYYGSTSEWQKVRFSDPLTKYFPAGAPAIEAFGPVLNQSQRFVGDHMNLVGADIRYKTDVGGIYSAIKANYKERGWGVS